MQEHTNYYIIIPKFKKTQTYQWHAAQANAHKNKVFKSFVLNYFTHEETKSVPFFPKVGFIKVWPKSIAKMKIDSLYQKVSSPFKSSIQNDFLCKLHLKKNISFYFRKLNDLNEKKQ